MITKIYDFYSTSCGPCKMLMQHLNKVADVYPEIIIEKFDENCTDKQKEFNIRSVPVLVFFDENNNEVERIEKAVPHNVIIDVIKKNA